jgi:MarR family transcriptional regulator, transcriptional regulator for hemolysin
MTTQLDHDLLTLVSDVARHMATCGDRLAKANGITQTQLIILARLAREPDLSQCELATIAEVSPISIARLIDRLEALGLVERRADPADRRIWRLRLTSKAAPLKKEVNRVRSTLHEAVTKGIEPSMLSTMTRGLRQMKENVLRCRADSGSS